MKYTHISQESQLRHPNYYNYSLITAFVTVFRGDAKHIQKSFELQHTASVLVSLSLILHLKVAQWRVAISGCSFSVNL